MCTGLQFWSVWYLQICTNIITFIVNKIRDTFNVEFVEWVPTGLKLGLCVKKLQHYGSPYNRNTYTLPSKSLTKISNHTGIKVIVENLLDQFNLLMEQRPYVWWFISEGNQ